MIRYYTESDSYLWDDFIQKSSQATFLHTRKFLSYHKNRFKDISVLCFDETNKLTAVFPAAIDPQDCSNVVSHPGITYGGIIYLDKLRSDALFFILDKLTNFYYNQGFKSIFYKSIPNHIPQYPKGLDIYYLWRAGAVITRRDLWNVIDLNKKRKLTKGRKWGVTQGIKNNIVISIANSYNDYNTFWHLLAGCLEERHDAVPVHTAGEMWALYERFSDKIELWIAKDKEGDMIAGTWIFKVRDNVWHTQYIASSQTGRELYGVDLLLEYLISKASENNIQYISFGASTENNGNVLNEGLFNYKAGFGIGSVIHDFYKLNLG